LLSEVNRKLLEEFKFRIIETLTIIRPEINKENIEEYLNSIGILIDNGEFEYNSSCEQYTNQEEYNYANREKGTCWQFD
jgi:hypothetical protein